MGLAELRYQVIRGTGEVGGGAESEVVEAAAARLDLLDVAHRRRCAALAFRPDGQHFAVDFCLFPVLGDEDPAPEDNVVRRGLPTIATAFIEIMARLLGGK